MGRKLASACGLTAEDAGAYDEDGGGRGFGRFWGRGHGWVDDGIGGKVSMIREEEMWLRYLLSENIVTIRKSVFWL